MHDKLPAEHTIAELTRLRDQIMESLRQSRELIEALDKIVPELPEPAHEEPRPSS